MAQVWLVTGSSRGLGRAIVEAGLAAGNKVMATARSIESLRDLSDRYGSQVKLFALDVTDESAANRAVETAIDTFGSLDVVINNAGYGNLSSIEETSLSDFRAQIETNLFGTIIVTKAALSYFRERKRGQFIQFSSVGGRIGPPGRGPYSAAKWGVEGFSEVLSREVASLGAKVIIVGPGGLLGSDAYHEAEKATCSLGRAAQMERAQSVHRLWDDISRLPQTNQAGTVACPIAHPKGG